MQGRPGQGGGAEQLDQDINGGPEPRRSARVPQDDQRCASCGQPGQPPTIGKPQPNDLTIRPFLGRLALLCRECVEVAMLDRAIRRPRP
jgi:hypothetical protein